MMKKNKFYLAGTLALLLTGSSLTGCSASNASQTTEKPPLSNERPDTETNTHFTELHALINLIGKTDSEVVAALGNGEVNLAEDTQKVMARDYTLTFLDTDVAVSAMMDDSENLQHLNIYLPDNDFAAWSSKLTSLLGEPTSAPEQAFESDAGIEVALWETNHTRISLKTAYGSLSIEISVL